MPTAQEKHYTVEAFDALINLPENADKRFELDQGSLIEVVPSQPIHVYIGSWVYHLIANFLEGKGLGVAYADGCLFYLPNGDCWIPDAAYVSFARQPGIPERYTLAPDLAVEVVSPGNSPREILHKVESYIEGGTRIVWVVYPAEKIVDVWRPAAPGQLLKQKLTLSDHLDGGEVLPGLSIPLAAIFPAE
ncbi:MAG: Uma2 family endonuclease [Anaerolineae bacterium]|nr:Uma2 family endonuclease [Anaerolineae bacterium]